MSSCKLFFVPFPVLLLCTGCYESYTEHYPPGAKQEQGKRRFCGIVCGTPRYEYDGLISSWYPNGTNESAINYASGLRQGAATNWHPNGNIKYVVNWKGDQRDGSFQIGYLNGARSASGTFSTNELKAVKFYDESGNQISQADWLRIGDNKQFW
jgi:hypothetical protein